MRRGYNEMMIYSGVLFLVLSLAIAFFANAHFGSAKREISPWGHWLICAAAVAAGCAIRFCALDTLLAGVNAEEALSAVQAKSLWQTGGFLFDGKLTTQFRQWTGDAGGPFLAFLAAPFVGVMGMTAAAVRIPLTLLSCAAMFAAYGIGKEVLGEKAGRWMLVVYALCPAFVLDARFAAAANAAVFLMPIAFYLLIRGFRTVYCLYAGMLTLGLLAYTYDVYFFVVPFVMVAAIAAAKASGVKVRHCAASGVLGFLVYLPALLTLWVNLSGSDGFVLFGAIEIPRLEVFSKAKFIWTGCQNIVQIVEAIRSQIYAVVFGCLFQAVRHENISNALFSPDGIHTFYTMGVPLVLVGTVVALCAWLDRKKNNKSFSVNQIFLAATGLTIFAVLLLVGNRGMNDYAGGTSVYDYSALFLFVALMMTLGLCRIEEKSVAGRRGMLALLAASVVMLGVFLFGGTYQNEANTHFWGLDEACQKAADMQKETGRKVYITMSVYPHVDPSAAAEMMYLYSTDADMVYAAQKRGEMFEAAYLEGIESLDSDGIYIAAVRDLYNCDMENWVYEEFGGYALLSQEK